MTGKIERVIAEKGLGFIAGDDGQDYVFNRAAVHGHPFETLRPNMLVSFDPVKGASGLRAGIVRVIPT